jgi:hypothetical protein
MIVTLDVDGRGDGAGPRGYAGRMRTVPTDIAKALKIGRASV